MNTLIPRTKAQEEAVLRRWINRAFARELYKWMVSAAPNRIPMNTDSYNQILAICSNVLRARFGPNWSVEIIPPDREARAQRMGPTVVLHFRERS